MKWVKAAAALIVLLIVAIAPPFLLAVFVGSPVPDLTGFGAQLTDESIIRLMSIIVWLLWAQTLWCIAAEVIAASRSAHLARIPGTFGIQQHLARVAVGAIITATIATPTIFTTAAAVASTATPAASQTTPVPQNTAAPSGAPAIATDRPDSGAPGTDPETLKDEASKDDDAAPVSVKVRRGDTLWGIAETRLGNGDRWTEIAALNEGRTMSDGHAFTTTDTIRPGWTLTLPADAAPTPSAGDADAEYIVQAGDTLSQIAYDHTGHASQWPSLFDASKDLDQPITMTDPDVIYPGQHIRLPHDERPRRAPNAAGPRPSDSRHPTSPKATGEVPATNQSDHTPGSPRSVEGADQQQTSEGHRDFAGSEQNRAESFPRTPSPVDHSATANDRAADGSLPGWVTPGLAGAGALLAGALLIALRSRRSAQRRHRRPGRTIPATDPRWTLAEKSINVAGSTTTNTIELIDTILKRTATTLVEAGQPMPQIAALEVTDTVVALHLRKPSMSAPVPWVAADDGLLWIIDNTTSFDVLGEEQPDQPAPWPLLVTIGHDERSTWLLNLEDQTIRVAGDEGAAGSFARFVAAEIACNPWSRHTRLDLIGVAEQIAPIDTDRIHVHTTSAGAVSDAVADAVRSIDRLAHYGTDTPTARAESADPDPWPSRALIIRDHEHVDRLEQLTGVTTTHPGTTGTALMLIVGDNAASNVEGATEIRLDNAGQLTIESVNLALTAVGLSVAEAHGCVALLAQADQLEDEAPADLEGDEPWRIFATSTGSLRDEYRIRREASPLAQSSSLLLADDADYVATAATTAEDLDALAPLVTATTSRQILEADAELDHDLENWIAHTCPRPRLTLLGPVGARTSGKPLGSRKAYYTELFAYLATRPYGATTDEVATAFDISAQRVRVDINVLRDWLGINPATAQKYLPDALNAPAARLRGVGVYQIVGGLTDIDLFRRLRVRAETRGPEGIDDLKQALDLVTGRPFDKLRPAGWGWLFDSDRLDQHLTSAIVDIAHLIATHSLQQEDIPAARHAAVIAIAAAPDEEIPRLDHAAVEMADGNSAEADQIVRAEVANRTDSTDAPTDLPHRTEQVIETHGWLRRRAM